MAICCPQLPIVLLKLSQSCLKDASQLPHSCPVVVSRLPPFCSRWCLSVVHEVLNWCPCVEQLTQFLNGAKWSPSWPRWCPSVIHAHLKWCQLVSIYNCVATRGVEWVPLILLKWLECLYICAIVHILLLLRTLWSEQKGTVGGSLIGRDGCESSWQIQINRCKAI